MEQGPPFVPIENHATLTAEICEVCRYVSEQRQGDLRREHGLTNLAAAILVEDLRAAGGDPLPVRALHVGSIGVEPGPVHRLEPRHWFRALWVERDVVLMLREGSP